jgi:hypothetical protein
MAGKAALIGRWFIDSGMRNGTPPELHDHVLTVHGGTGEWKTRLRYSSEREDDAYLADGPQADADRAPAHRRLLT